MMFDHQYDEEIKELLSEYDVSMVPLLNPDGYSFTKKVSCTANLTDLYNIIGNILEDIFLSIFTKLLSVFSDTNRQISDKTSPSLKAFAFVVGFLNKYAHPLLEENSSGMHYRIRWEGWGGISGGDGGSGEGGKG